jgi:uncharacterized repeat protein (TIGR03803 family)
MKKARTRREKTSILVMAVLILALVGVAPFSYGQATEKIIYNFPGIPNGGAPTAPLTFDGHGNLYGTTAQGGDNNGIVFKLTPGAGGVWTETVLYKFIGATDGQEPVTGVVFDAKGNLYGTTIVGGPLYNGTLYELMPQVDGTWKEKTLHSFQVSGGVAASNLIFDASGNLYGTCAAGGMFSIGTVFELIPGAHGWTDKTIHTFVDNGIDGISPVTQAGLVLDAAGNFYGTTVQGGATGYGTVFQLVRTAGGSWIEKILYNFSNNGTDGYNPQGALILDSAGNLYGTTNLGGVYGEGTVFELVRKADGQWKEEILHDFGSGVDGSLPQASLVLDASANLYGVTAEGGAGGLGTVFELVRDSAGNYTEDILHDFAVYPPDGANPYAALVFDGSGNLFGTTYHGGTGQAGTVFEVTP